MGYGMIPIDMRLMQDLYDAFDEWNLEKVNVEELHDKLHLPPDFRIRHIGVDYARRCYLVMIEAPQLPDVPPGHMIAQIHPVLTQEDGVIRLQELRIETPDYSPYY